MGSNGYPDVIGVVLRVATHLLERHRERREAVAESEFTQTPEPMEAAAAWSLTTSYEPTAGCWAKWGLGLEARWQRSVRSANDFSFRRCQEHFSVIPSAVLRGIASYPDASNGEQYLDAEAVP